MPATAAPSLHHTALTSKHTQRIQSVGLTAPLRVRGHLGGLQSVVGKQPRPRPRPARADLRPVSSYLDGELPLLAIV